MILKDHSPAMRRFPRQLGLFFLIVFVGSAIFLILKTIANQPDERSLDAMVFADAENRRDSVLVSGDHTFGNDISPLLPQKTKRIF